MASPACLRRPVPLAAALLALAPALLALGCAGTRPPGAREELRRAYGYEGRPDDGASIRYLEARPQLLAAALRPEVAALSRVLAEGWATPFDPRDVPELVAWTGDAGVRAALLAPATRGFARALVAQGAVGGGTLRIAGGPLWREAPIVLAALALQAGAAETVLELRRGYGYVLSPLDAPEIVRLTGDGVLREALRSAAVRASWARLEAASGVAFRPSLARVAIDLAAEPGAAETLRILRQEDRLRADAPGLVVLARLLGGGRGTDLLAPAHRAALARLRDRPGRAPSLSSLPATLALAAADRPGDLLGVLLSLGWWPRPDDPDEAAAIARLAGGGALRDLLEATTAPPDAGRAPRLRSLPALLDALGAGASPLAAWLPENDAAFLGRLPDPGGPREGLERAILAARADRPIAPRPRTGRDEAGLALPGMNRVDLLRILAVQASLAVPGRARWLVEVALADRAEPGGERGGRIVLDEGGRAEWLEEAVVSGEGPAGDRWHRLAAPADPRETLATWHVHARGGRAVAGPSAGAGASDLAAANRTGIDGVVVTLLGEDAVDVDVHDSEGRVLDLGVHRAPVGGR